MNAWSNGNERARESDTHVAALLTSALIGRTALPTGTGAEQEAAHAVNLYRCVLAALMGSERARVEPTTSPTMDSSEMQMLDVSRDGARYRYGADLYDKLDDALRSARIDQRRR